MSTLSSRTSSSTATSTPPRVFSTRYAYICRVFRPLLGCIECTHECRLLSPLFAVSVCQSVRPSVCLSRGSTRLRCAKTAEQIKILFGVNTLGCPRNTVLDGGSDPPLRRGWGFDATFAKLLWPFVVIRLLYALPAWGCFLSKKLSGITDAYLKHCYRFRSLSKIE